MRCLSVAMPKCVRVRCKHYPSIRITLMATSSVTQKGQVTVPVEMRDAFNDRRARLDGAVANSP